MRSTSWGVSGSFIGELELTKRLFVLTRQDSHIGIEATNHCNCYPLDLVEKVVNCRYILDEWLPSMMPHNGRTEEPHR